MHNEITEWLDKAKADLAIAKYNFEGDFYEDACFHSQQAAEKALKAVYIKKFKKLRKIHDLNLLAKDIRAPAEIIDIGDELNPFYIISRYPGPEEPLGEEDAKKAIEQAKKVLEWVEKEV